MSFKQWYENANTIPIDNNLTYHDWLYVKFLKDRHNWKHVFKLLAYNKDKFKDLFGRQDAVWVGEFRFYCWKREFQGKTFLLMTASGKGTCIELVTEHDGFRFAEDKKEGEIIIEFVKDLMEKL